MKERLIMIGCCLLTVCLIAAAFQNVPSGVPMIGKGEFRQTVIIDAGHGGLTNTIH